MDDRLVGVDHAGRAGEETVVDDGAAVGQAAGEAHGGRPADGVERQRDGRAAACRRDPFGEIVAVDDDDADRQQLGDQRVAANDVRGVQPARPGERDDVAADRELAAFWMTQSPSFSATPSFSPT